MGRRRRRDGAECSHDNDDAGEGYVSGLALSVDLSVATAAMATTRASISAIPGTSVGAATRTATTAPTVAAAATSATRATRRATDGYGDDNDYEHGDDARRLCLGGVQMTAKVGLDGRVVGSTGGMDNIDVSRIGICLEGIGTGGIGGTDAVERMACGMSGMDCGTSGMDGGIDCGMNGMGGTGDVVFVMKGIRDMEGRRGCGMSCMDCGRSGVGDGMDCSMSGMDGDMDCGGSGADMVSGGMDCGMSGMDRDIGGVGYCMGGMSDACNACAERMRLLRRFRR